MRLLKKINYDIELFPIKINFKILPITIKNKSIEIYNLDNCLPKSSLNDNYLILNNELNNNKDNMDITNNLDRTIDNDIIKDINKDKNLYFIKKWLENI